MEGALKRVHRRRRAWTARALDELRIELARQELRRHVADVRVEAELAQLETHRAKDVARLRKGVLEGSLKGRGWDMGGSREVHRHSSANEPQSIFRARVAAEEGMAGGGAERARPSATWSMRAEESAVRIERAEVVISGVSAAAAAVAAHREVIDSSTSTQRKGCRLSNCERATCG